MGGGGAIISWGGGGGGGWGYNGKDPKFDVEVFCRTKVEQSNRLNFTQKQGQMKRPGLRILPKSIHVYIHLHVIYMFIVKPKSRKEVLVQYLIRGQCTTSTYFFSWLISVDNDVSSYNQASKTALDRKDTKPVGHHGRSCQVRVRVRCQKKSRIVQTYTENIIGLF